MAEGETEDIKDGLDNFFSKTTPSPASHSTPVGSPLVEEIKNSSPSSGAAVSRSREDLRMKVFNAFTAVRSLCQFVSVCQFVSCYREYYSVSFVLTFCVSGDGAARARPHLSSRAEISGQRGDDGEQVQPGPGQQAQGRRSSLLSEAKHSGR